MTKHKTADLEGALLDAAVAMSLGHRIVTSDIHETEFLDGKTGALVSGNWSTEWADGGPLIEREGMCVGKQSTDTNVWIAWHQPGSVGRFGQTPLIAAMRAYVAHKLGDEVELP